MVQLRYLLHIPLMGAKPARERLRTGKVAEERDDITFCCTTSQRFITYFNRVPGEESAHIQIWHVEGIYKANSYTHGYAGPDPRKKKCLLSAAAYKSNTGSCSLLTQHQASQLGKWFSKRGSSSFQKVSQREQECCWPVVVPKFKTTVLGWRFPKPHNSPRSQKTSDPLWGPKSVKIWDRLATF